jgi:hypothetical protein
VDDLREGVVQFLSGGPFGVVLLRHLSLELAPFLLGPAELLCRRGEVQEMHRDDVCSWSQVGVPYQGIELAAGLGQSSLDGLESLSLLFGVDVSAGSSQAYSLSSRVLIGRYARYWCGR